MRPERPRVDEEHFPGSTDIDTVLGVPERAHKHLAAACIHQALCFLGGHSSVHSNGRLKYRLAHWRHTLIEWLCPMRSQPLLLCSLQMQQNAL